MITRCQHKASYSLLLTPLKVIRSTNSHQGQVLAQRYLSLQNVSVVTEHLLKNVCALGRESRGGRWGCNCK